MGKHGKKSKKGSHEAANPPAISESKNNQLEAVNQQITEVSTDQRICDASVNQQIAEVSTDQRICDASVNQQIAEVSTDQRICDASVNQQIAEVSTDQRICDASVNQQMVDVSANQTIVSANPSSVNVSTNQTTMDHSNEDTSLSVTSLCALCGLITGDWLVQCDDCAKWYHFKCVDLESIGEHDPWSCLECLQRQFAENWDAPNSRTRNVEVVATNRENLIESVHDKSASGEIRSNDQTMSNPETEINLSRQSQSKQSEIDSGTAMNASDIRPDVSITTTKTQINRFSSHFNQLERTKTSTILADNQRASKFMVPVDVHRPISSMFERIRLGNSSIETQPTRTNAKSSLSFNEGHLTRNGSTLSLPASNENQQQNPERSDHNIQDPIISNVGNIDPTPSVKSHRSSSKTISSASSRKSRADLEQMRLQEQLKLQEKIDEERIKLELKALELKADREKKFLEEKYRAMESNDNGSSDTASHASMKKNDRTKSDASQLSNKTELVSAWVQGQNQQHSKFTPLTNIRARKFNDKIDKFNFDYSISVNDDELREIKKMRSKEQEARSSGWLNKNDESKSFHYNPETSSKLINESGKVSTPRPSRRFMRDNTNNNIHPLPNDDHPNITSEKQSEFQQLGDQRDCQPSVNQNSQQKSNNFQNITAPPPYQESQGNSRPSYEQNQGYMRPQPRFSHQPIPTMASQNFRSTHQQPNPSSLSTPILSQQGSGTAILQNQQNPSYHSHQRGFGFINQQQHQSSQPILTSSQQSGGITFPINQCQQPQYSSTTSMGQRSFGIVPSNQAASSAYQLEQSQRPPSTANQIAARHVVIKKLPYFYENPAEWPEFIQKYSNTTAACGFDNTENSDRLTECLNGKAKIKVAPIKPLLTIPRLELLAAVLGTRLAKSVGDSLSIPIEKRTFWSDSRDVLCWIRSINRKYRQFVAFRVGEILETSKESEWRFVPGKLNVADEGTKWPNHPKLDQNSRWYKGQKFLLEDPKVWQKDLSREETTNTVNYRPLTYLEIESNDDEALTPNYFLLGLSNGIMAPGEFLYEEKTLTKSWRRCQELTNVFWRRWIKEYLPTLTRRSKWFPKAKPIEVGDVVLLVDEKNARNSYPRGIVLEVMPDKYGQVRQALVKTTVVIPGKVGQTKDANVRISTKIRPAAKLAVLDVAGKFVEEVVKPVEVSATKCLTKGENVTNNNSNNLTDVMSNPDSNLANIGVSGKRTSDSRKPLLAKRRSKRIAAKSHLLHNSDHRK